MLHTHDKCTWLLKNLSLEKIIIEKSTTHNPEEIAAQDSCYA